MVPAREEGSGGGVRTIYFLAGVAACAGVYNGVAAFLLFLVIPVGLDLLRPVDQ